MGFDPKKHYLGRLCKRGHEYKKTGKTLFKLKSSGKSGCCVDCTNLLRRTRYKKTTRRTMREWRANNPEKIKAYQARERRIGRDRQRPQRRNIERDLRSFLYNRLFLSDAYISRCFCANNGIYITDPAIIKGKREQISLSREIKEARRLLK